MWLGLLSTLALAADGDRYTVEFFNGASLANARTLGMGGAVTGVANGAAAMMANPAAAARRRENALDRPWDADGMFAILALPLVDRVLDRQREDTDPILLLHPSGTLRYRGFGAGAYAYGHGYAASWSGDDGAQVDASLTQALVGAGAAWTTADAGLTVGAALLVQTARITVGDPTWLGREDLALSASGLGVEVGALWSPPNTPFRVGASMRPPMRAEAHTPLAGVPLDGARLPLELAAGGSLRLGARPYNRKPTYGEREPAHTPSGRVVLFAADLVLTGRSLDAIPVEDLLDEAWTDPDFAAAEAGLTLGARGGVEGEVLEDRLRLRGGAYWEPARFQPGRLHGTLGAEWGFPGLRGFRLSGALDGARGYQRVALSLGVW
ncbi:MAG: hypothetical protein H6739_26265 [Alphaproteobacteria bacterium]|nr:hypothetical protein [Alphaproteobacteria bacterium]